MPERLIRVHELVDTLKTRIRAGEIGRGSRLPQERQLASELGVTRPTLRVALSLLQEEGYVESRRGRSGGWFVTDLSAPEERWIERMRADAEEFRDILDFRIAVEVMAASLAAIRRTSHDLQVLDEAVDQYEEAFRRAGQLVDGQVVQVRDLYMPVNDGPPADLGQAGARFHDAVAAASHSRRLEEAAQKARADLFRGGRRLIHDDVLTESSGDHREIANAIRSGDRATAADTMNRHLERGRKAIERIVLP